MIIIECWQHVFSWLFLSISFNRQVLLTTSSVSTEQMNVSFRWLANTGVSMCQSRQEDVRPYFSDTV